MPSSSPIRHAVVLAHPDPSSFNAAIAHAYCEAVEAAGQQVILRDLYAMNFDPVLKAHERPGRSDFRLSPDVQAELALLCGANVVTFVFPVWFGMPPAILVGYIDRVLGAGTTVGQVRHGAGRGLLDNGHLCAITTSGASEDWLQAQGQTQALRDLAGTYLFRAFAMQSTEAVHIGNVVEGAPANFFQDNLARVRQRAASICARVAEELHGTPLPPQLGDGS
ncbi:NAD(P)H-dependent oxidoreductase [Sphingobium chlorophenolicum]|uniref:Putative NAD(P)H dehydrogenase n=1 Tax=Sphingobium chlorophenolicum TaxID=46429 RepID=A0A081RCG9_SPHCR|nr:NAD(P)H-dependent oxidoreductase [Sphingobium chlorophenolicum]KEQ52892.1 putative NAD(P)H dehydrogenase [Sphingobium chlorophenolicum]